MAMWRQGVWGKLGKTVTSSMVLFYNLSVREVGNWRLRRSVSVVAEERLPSRSTATFEDTPREERRTTEEITVPPVLRSHDSGER